MKFQKGNVCSPIYHYTMQCNAPIHSENKTESSNASQITLLGEYMDTLSEKPLVLQSWLGMHLNSMWSDTRRSGIV